MRALPFLAAFCVLTVVGCGGGTSEEVAPPATTPSETAAPEAADRPLAPEIAGTSLDDEPISLADFRGGPVLVNVWSSW